MIKARFEEAGSFADAVETGEKLATYGVGPGGEAIALVTDARRTLIAGELGPLHRDAAAIRIGSALERIELRALETRLPLVQALPNGEILIVDKLCERHDDESHDLNASIYSSNGSLVRRFLVGDGIREVQTTPDGRIWISYTDEGIFGTDGWHHGPVGAAGLLRWATDGTLEWEYAPPPGLDWMADCEALNVADDATWACYYDGFPLVSDRARRHDHGLANTDPRCRCHRDRRWVGDLLRRLSR